MTKTNILTGILAIAVLTTVIGASTANQADAAHNWFQPTWSTGSHTYSCESNLSNLSSAYIDECGDLQNAADVWNDVVNSDWDLNYSSSGSIPIGSANLQTGTLAVTRVVDNPITSARITFNTDYTWADSNIATAGYDYESVAIHEMGHLLHLKHEPFNGSSPMYHTFAEDTVRRTLVNHDVDVIRDMY